MTRLMIGIVLLAIGCMILGVVSRGMYDNYTPLRLTEENRRENYLMPQKDSATYKQWTAKYSDSADSWEMFSIAFHTKYLSELNNRITKLEKQVQYGCKLEDFNEANKPTDN